MTKYYAACRILGPNPFFAGQFWLTTIVGTTLVFIRFSANMIKLLGTANLYLSAVAR